MMNKLKSKSSTFRFSVFVLCFVILGMFSPSVFSAPLAIDTWESYPVGELGKPRDLVGQSWRVSSRPKDHPAVVLM